MPNADAPPATLSIGEAAQALGLSVDTLRRWEAAEVARLLRERQPAGRSSARNRLTGIVLSVQRDGVMAQVELACGPFRVVSLMSREAADDLGLRPGSRADAVVKATTVVVEVPR